MTTETFTFEYRDVLIKYGRKDDTYYWEAEYGDDTYGMTCKDSLGRKADPWVVVAMNAAETINALKDGRAIL